MLECIEEESSAELASKAFLWIIHSLRPLNLDELVEALALNENDRRLNRNATFADPRDLLRICSGLVYEDSRNNNSDDNSSDNNGLDDINSGDESSDDNDPEKASRRKEIKFCHYTVEV